MRFLLYNIRYGTGTGWDYHLPFPFSGMWRPTQSNLDKIIGFLRQENPDIVGLIEVDNGSYRTGKLSQVERIAESLNHAHAYACKYGQTSLAKRLPIMKEQGNAFITNQDIQALDFHYFTEGVKRLVIELEFEQFVIYLVHLSLLYRHRQYQLAQLYTLFREQRKPIIVAGDFNAFWGDRELQLFLGATNLLNANVEGEPTFPARSPLRQLDFVFHSPGIQVTNFRVPQVRFSDHLPIVCDFDLA